MPTNANSIMQTYLAATEEIRKVLVSFTATPAQKDAAEAALADLTTALAIHSVQQVEGRTALLTALIVELNGVIDKIRVNPIGDVLGRLNGLLGTANRLLTAEKATLREAVTAPAPVGASVGEGAPAPMIGIPGISQLIFTAEAVLSDRLSTTSDPSERTALRSQIETLSGLRGSVSNPDAAVRASLLMQLAETLDEAVTNLRERPFDQVLGSLQRLGDEVAIAQGEVTRDLRGGSAEPLEEFPVGERVPAIASGAVAAERGEAPAPAGREEAGQGPTSVSRSGDLAALKDEYLRLFNTCKIRSEEQGGIDRFYVLPLIEGRRQYEDVGNTLGIPWWFIGIIHGLECSFNFRTHLHNGDPLTQRTVNHPPGHPRGGTPPFTWRQSALDALQLKKFDRETDWSLPSVLFRWEKFNGMGYRMRGLASPYLWSFSNHYEKGKFVRDGVFDPEAVSRQCGAATLLKHLVEEEIVQLKPRTREILADGAPTNGAPALSEALLVAPLKSAKKELKFPGLLERGAKDSGNKRDVHAVQEWCSFHRCPTDVDGDFGSGTEDAVRRFQAGLGLPESGVVDERTWLELTAPLRRVLKRIAPGAHEGLYDLTVRVADQHLAEHPVEVGGDNRGPWVRLYMDGKDGSGQLWCAGFVCFVLGQAALALGQEMPFKRQVGVDQLVSDAKASDRFVAEKDLGTASQRLNKLRPGCLFAVRKTASDWTHTGIVIGVGPESFETIEGNTNDEGVSNGFEVCKRSRSYKNKDFMLLA
jgi:lysozyme family protein